MVPGVFLSEINRRPCWLQIIFSYFVFSSKIHKRWLISWIHCTLSEFLNKLVKQQKQLYFLFRHISLYSESSVWLPDSLWDRDESNEKSLSLPTIALRHFLPSVWGRRPEQAPRAKEIGVVLWEQVWNVPSSLGCVYTGGWISRR